MESSDSSETSIEEWLASIGLREYADRFVANAVDTSILPDLTEQDLKDLEIPLGHRRKILRAIANSFAPLLPVAPYPPAIPSEGAQRRQLTVMFCDLVGSTAMSAKLDPEDMRDVISSFQDCVAETIGRYNGFVARYMGDGVLIYFGYPQAYEDDTEQAVHAGLALLDAIPKLRSGLAIKLEICIGIATGTVVVGDLLTTEGGVREHSVVGDTPNLAARLQSMAQPGSAVVCTNTRHLTDGYFEYRELGPSLLKGWTEPINIWQVMRSTGVRTRFEAQHQKKLMPPLGRDEETELLLRRWRAARRGEGRAVLLTGEPGIGKSHIAAALNGLLDEPHITLNYYCSSHHQNSALFPFIGQLERAAGFERTDSPAARLGKLESALTGQGVTAVALLSHLLSLPADARFPLPDSGPQKRKEETLSAFSEHLDRLAARQPVLMIFEDVHWIDPTSLELLAHIVECLPHMRLLLLMTARPEFVPPWPGHAHVSTLPLTRLSRRDGAALIERVTGGKALPDEVVTQILVRTDGVPLFVEELTKAIIESGQMKERGGQYVLENPLPSLAIPATLNASLMARLDRLASVRDVAQIGSVIGREFSYELLNATAGMPKSKIDEALDQLVQAELIFRRGAVPQTIYTFKHALMRDAAYAGLLKSRRAQIHAALADAFEEKFPEIVEGQPETVAHHLTEAGLPDRAIGYWLQAGKKAAEASAPVEAIAHLQRGLELVRAMPETPARDRTELDFVFAMGPCLIATQGPATSDAVATFSRARELCDRIGDAPEFMQVMFWLTTASVMRGELPRAKDTIIPLLERAETRKDRPAEINATRGKAMILMFMGEIVEAGKMIERAYEVFSASGEDDRLAARAAGQDAGVADLALMSWTLWLLGKPDTAAKCTDTGLRRADSIGHPHTQAYAYYYASVLFALRGQPDVARMHAERCISLSEMHGFRQWYGLSRAVKGICATMLNPSSDEFDDVRTAIDEYIGAGYQLGITALYVLLCPGLQLRGQHETAMDFLDRGLSIAEVNSEKIFESELYRLKAQALRRSGTNDAAAKADAMLERALKIARAQQARSLELRIARDLAQIQAGHGDLAAARHSLSPVCDWFKEGEGTQDLRQAKTFLRELQ